VAHHENSAGHRRSRPKHDRRRRQKGFLHRLVWRKCRLDRRLLLSKCLDEALPATLVARQPRGVHESADVHRVVLDIGYTHVTALERVQADQAVVARAPIVPLEPKAPALSLADKAPAEILVDPTPAAPRADCYRSGKLIEGIHGAARNDLRTVARR